MDTIVIETKNLIRAFGKGVTEKNAVDGITFDVKKGEIFGVLGPNGAGKTTTIRMMCGLLMPTSGDVKVLDMDVSDPKSSKRLKQKINMVSGGERGLYYRLSGRQNLHYFADLYGIPKGEQKAIVSEVLDLVKMTDAADKKVEEYSRGMKQRIHIARALLNRPEIIFLDEPTIGLDPEISLQIRKIIKELSEKGTTIILTTHYMTEAEELCDRMILLKKGKIVGYGTVNELRDKVADDTMIRIVTTKDPSALSEKALQTEGVMDMRINVIPGRFETNIRVHKDFSHLDRIDSMFEQFEIRSIGYDEPTLEDTYLYLTGGE
ncbi:MAG: ABC transporter ATP-binding protein [Candidatus Methanomethylophilaceae archaeon]|nr:ABC transporter ATP-binding protein [Candidatus Methanomethylophilaceae archaeon]